MFYSEAAWSKLTGFHSGEILAGQAEEKQTLGLEKSVGFLCICILLIAADDDF